jgi:hypothetical protein
MGRCEMSSIRLYIDSYPKVLLGVDGFHHIPQAGEAGRLGNVSAANISIKVAMDG